MKFETVRSGLFTRYGAAVRLKMATEVALDVPIRDHTTWSGQRSAKHDEIATIPETHRIDEQIARDVASAADADAIAARDLLQASQQQLTMLEALVQTRGHIIAKRSLAPGIGGGGVCSRFRSRGLLVWTGLGTERGKFGCCIAEQIVRDWVIGLRRRLRLARGAGGRAAGEIGRRLGYVVRERVNRFILILGRPGEDR